MDAEFLKTLSMKYNHPYEYELPTWAYRQCSSNTWDTISTEYNSRPSNPRVFTTLPIQEEAPGIWEQLRKELEELYDNLSYTPFFEAAEPICERNADENLIMEVLTGSI